MASLVRIHRSCLIAISSLNPHIRHEYPLYQCHHLDRQLSVNFVFDFIFVFVIVFVNDIVFSLSFISRFCMYFRFYFRFVFVLSFFNIVLRYQFEGVEHCMHIVPPQMIDVTNFMAFNRVNVHHNKYSYSIFKYTL